MLKNNQKNVHGTSIILPNEKLSDFFPQLEQTQHWFQHHMHTTALLIHQMLTLLNMPQLWSSFGHWEEFYKSCKATWCTTLPLTHVDGPACFCKPHWGIRTFIKAMISSPQCYIYCIVGVLQVHDLSVLSLATIPCKQFLFCAGETNTPPINCFAADWGKGSCSLDNKTTCFLWPWNNNSNLKFNN